MKSEQIDLSRLPDLNEFYDALFSAYGPQHWWPGETPFEVMIGAILTQNTAWANVEKAIGNLKERGLLHPGGIERTDSETLAGLIRPSGYFNQKTKKLKAFIVYFGSTYRFDISAMRRRPLGELREELLAVFGIGEETADSILLYALEKPVFVIDAYTKRIVSRLAGVLSADISYGTLQRLFEQNISESVERYNEYHALLVAHGKDVCRPKPRCDICPVTGLCRYFSLSESP